MTTINPKLKPDECATHLHCHSCLHNLDGWRDRNGGYSPCPYGFTLDNIPQPDQSKIATQIIDRAPCQFLGEDTGAYATCIEGCGKGVKLSVFFCAILSTCTIARRAEGISACCKSNTPQQCCHYHPQHDPNSTKILDKQTNMRHTQKQVTL